jgi:hypothetical protein
MPVTASAYDGHDVGPIAFKYRLVIRESSNGFFVDNFAKLGKKGTAEGAAKVCKLFGGDCAQTANDAVDVIQTITPEEKEGPGSIEHHGLIRAPLNYEICRTKIDMNNASIDGGSSFSGEIVRDQNHTVNGLGYYAAVPKADGKGHSVEADLYLLYVRAGTLAQNGCWADSDHSDAMHLWMVDHGNTVLMKPEAHFP